MAKTKKKKSIGKWIIIFSILLIIGLIVYSKVKGPNGIKVTLGAPELSSITETIPANGKIQPVTEVKISPDVSGEIIELNFQEGDVINKGDLIIKIKQDTYISMKERAIASLNAIKAQYLQQEAQLKQVELSYHRNKKLYDEKAISKSEYETALSQYEVAKEQLKSAEYNVQSAQASLKEAEENLIKTTIYAPMDGIISKLSVEKGERVVGTSQMAGTEMLRIADFDKMQVLVDVNENDIIRLKQLDTAEISIDAYPGRKFTGVVTQIANSAKSASASADQITNFEVKIYLIPQSYSDLLKENAMPFRPGMSASVQIQTSKRDNVLTIPIQSITTRKGLSADTTKVDDGVTEYVFVVDPENPDKVKATVIKTGIQDMNKIEVLEGLSAESKIVTGPYNAVSKTLTKNSRIVEDTKKEKKEKKSKDNDEK